MSWAANRTTSRIEDEAYSLFGIFGVNMPLLYGEGEASFIRLQEEIIKTSTDHSIFVWEPEFANRNSSIFATSPYDFRNGHNIVQWAELQWDESYEMTNIGLRVKLPIFEDNPLNFLAILNCRCDSNFTGPIALNLRPEGMLGHKTGIGEYEGSGREYSIRESPRCSIVDIGKLSLAEKHSIVILKRPRGYRMDFNFHPKCWLRIGARKAGPDFEVLDAFPKRWWNLATGVMSMPSTAPSRAALLLHDRHGTKFVVAFGYWPDSPPWDPSLKSWVKVLQYEEDLTLQKACEESTSESDSAKLGLNSLEEISVEMEQDDIMNATVFIIKVSVNSPS